LAPLARMSGSGTAQGRTNRHRFPLFSQAYKCRTRRRAVHGREPVTAPEIVPAEDDLRLTEALGGGAEPPPPADDPDRPDFTTAIVDALKTSGVENGKKGERLEFLWIELFASRRGHVQLEGRYLEDGVERRAAIAIGPEFGTVGYDMVRAAAREAADLFDALVVCGFAFAPETDATRLNLGRLRLIKANMHPSLRDPRLKVTKAANLFTIFGEPDVRIHEDGETIRVEILGVDVLDPTTGETRSTIDPRTDVACWFVDDDYDEESFFVRQAYFLGRDPYESLKRMLKAEIDEAAWAELNSTISVPFPRPASGRICVKVIDHYGNEVQKVFAV